jgi:PAS domain S-box-containing protein
MEVIYTHKLHRNCVTMKPASDSRRKAPREARRNAAHRSKSNGGERSPSGPSKRKVPRSVGVAPGPGVTNNERATNQGLSRKPPLDELVGTAAIIDALREGVWVIGKASHTIFVNARMAKMLGYTPEEMFGKRLFEFIDERGVELATRMLDRQRAGIDEQHEFELVGKDGRRVHALLETSPITNADGSYAGAVARVMDITGSRLVEREFEATNRRLQTLLETCMEGIAIGDTDENITYANRALAEILGYREEELIGMNLRDLMDAEEFAKVQEQSNIRRAGKVSRYELVMRCKNEETRVVQVSASPVWDNQGNFVGSMGILIDLTEQKKAEKATQDMNAELLSLVRAIPDVVFFKDTRGRNLIVNEAFERLVGLSEPEIVGKTDEQLLPLDLVKQCKKSDGEVLSTVRQVLFEEQTTGKDGVTRFFETIKSPILDDKDKVVGLVGVSRDVTQHKQAEEALRLSEERYRQLVESAHEGVWVTDASSRTTFVNARMAEMLGYTRAEMLGKDRLSFMDATDREIARHYAERRKKGLRDQYDIELIRKDGTHIHATVAASPITDSGGNYAGALTLISDVTERKRAENEASLLQSITMEVSRAEDLDSALRAVLGRVCEATGWDVGEVWIPRPDGSYLECSPAWYDRTGGLSRFRKETEGFVYASGEGIAGRIWQSKKPLWVKELELVKEYPRAPIALRYGFRSTVGIPVTAAGDVVAVMLFGLTVPRDQDERWVDLVSSIGSQLGQLIWRKRAEDELRAHSQHLEQLVQERTRKLKEAERLATIGETALMVGHDLRNPLQAIVNSLYLVNTMMGEQPLSLEESKESPQQLSMGGLLDEIEKQVQYMNGVVSGLTDFARPMRLRLIEIDARQLIDEALSTSSVPQDVEATVRVEEDVPRLLVDPQMMKRVLTNLILNAVQAMPKGGKLTTRVSKSGETILISVRDTGRGIPDEVLPKLFNPLFTTKAKGVGLGLAVCKRVVEAHGGTISVKSWPNRGSEFTLTIPLKIA